MKHFSINFVLVVLFVFASAFSVSQAQGSWIRLGYPVLNPGSPGEWDNQVIGMPTVVFDGSTYHMWYAAADAIDNIKRIGYATSADGVNWTKYDDPATPNPPFAESDPVLSPGEAGSWDDERVLLPFVLLIDTVYHMWFGGSDVPATNGHHAIGHATSADGITWVEASNNPVLDVGDPGQWDDVWILGPCVLFDDSVYHMWYYAWGGLDDQLKIGHATSPHPDSTWTKDPNNPVLSFGVPGSWDYPRLEAPNVVYNGSTYHMWYSGGSGFTWQIGHATSPDPDSIWTKDTLNPVFPKGPTGGWDDQWVGFCSVILDSANSIYKMWYTGGNADWDGHVGYATAPVTGIKVLNENIPSGYVLHQNYPNPFNPTTNIEFSIPKSEFVTLKIYNILGEEVATLVSEKLPAGEYKYDWPAIRLASGVYIYRIKAGEFQQIKKMILIK